jgi:hypothetical protein
LEINFYACCYGLGETTSTLIFLTAVFYLGVIDGTFSLEGSLNITLFLVTLNISEFIVSSILIGSSTFFNSTIRFGFFSDFLGSTFFFGDKTSVSSTFLGSSCTSWMFSMLVEETAEFLWKVMVGLKVLTFSVLLLKPSFLLMYFSKSSSVTLDPVRKLFLLRIS